MSIQEKAKQQIVNIIELLVNLVIVGLIAGKACVDCESTERNQFVNVTVFGYFIVNILIVLNIFIEDQEFHKYWRAVVSILGAVMFLIAAILIFEYISDYTTYGDSTYVGTVTAAAVLCLVMTVLYVIDTVLVFIYYD